MNENLTNDRARVYLMLIFYQSFIKYYLCTKLPKLAAVSDITKLTNETKGYAMSCGEMVSQMMTDLKG